MDWKVLAAARCLVEAFKPKHCGDNGLEPNKEMWVGRIVSGCWWRGGALVDWLKEIEPNLVNMICDGWQVDARKQKHSKENKTKAKKGDQMGGR
jgi:hypothetical protein